MVKGLRLFLSTFILLLLAYADSAGQLSISFDTAYTSQYYHYRIFALLNIKNNSAEPVGISKEIAEMYLVTIDDIADTGVAVKKCSAMVHVNKKRVKRTDNLSAQDISALSAMEYETLALQEQAFFEQNKQLQSVNNFFVIPAGQSITIHTVFVSDIMTYDRQFINSLTEENVEISYWLRVRHRYGDAGAKQQWMFCADPGFFSRAYFEQIKKERN